jgi:hypothetical protein
MLILAITKYSHCHNILNDDNTPYLAGFGSVDENLYGKLIKAKLPASTWPDLPLEVLEDKHVQQMAIFLRQTRFFLPVHRSITPLQIKKSTLRLN